MRASLFTLGILLLIVPEILRVYFIMPFPGSQEDVATNTFQVDLAYFLHKNIWWIRLIGLALALGPFVHYLRRGRWGKRVAVLIPALLCALVYYAFNFRFMADKMFYPPRTKWMAAPQVTDSTANSLVIAVEHNGDARAYPIELIGYHHQVLDTIGGEPMMITYCTVCRTGRVFSPKVNGEQETFRLVGMDHFNAMFEDSRTGSWWRQVNGECVEGPLKGQHLTEWPSAQYTLEEWARSHPNGLVFQPDTVFDERYAWTKGFDDGTIDSDLEQRDSASWQPKSWVVGVVRHGQARAYDWNDLVHMEHIEDTLGGDSITVLLKHDHVDFLVLVSDTSRVPFDVQKGATPVLHWNWPTPIPAYQEFWHSWRTFHPNTTRYEPRS